MSGSGATCFALFDDETDRDHDLAPRRIVQYRTDNGEIFDVPFADDAEGVWSALLAGGLVPGASIEKPVLSHTKLAAKRDL